MFWLRFHELLVYHLNFDTVNLTTLKFLEREPAMDISLYSRYYLTEPELPVGEGK